MAAASSLSKFDQFKALAQTPQFYWWVGHAITLIFSALSLATFCRITIFYKLAFIGALMSYSIVIRSSHQSFNLSMECAARVFSDENFSYAFLAIYWLINKTAFGELFHTLGFFSNDLVVALLPFSAYSFFHFTGYLQSTVLPFFFPSIKKELETKCQTPSFPTQLSGSLKNFSNKYSAQTIEAASFMEVSVVPLYLILRVVTLFFYGQFLRQRASQSAQTRASFSKLAAILDTYILKPSIPAPIQNAYGYIKNYMASMVIRIPSNTNRPQ